MRECKFLATGSCVSLKSRVNKTIWTYLTDSTAASRSILQVNENQVLSKLKRSQLPKIYLTKESSRIVLKLRQWNVLTVEERNLEIACIFTTVHRKVWNYLMKIIPELQVTAWELQTLLKTVTIFYATHSTFNPLPSLKLQPWLSYGGRWQGRGKTIFFKGKEGKKQTKKSISSRWQVTRLFFFQKKINTAVLFKPGYPTG